MYLFNMIYYNFVLTIYVYFSAYKPIILVLFQNKCFKLFIWPASLTSALKPCNTIKTNQLTSLDLDLQTFSKHQQAGNKFRLMQRPCVGI